MSINGANYNPYLYKDIKAALNSSRAVKNKLPLSLDNSKGSFASNSISNTDRKTSAETIRESISKTKSEQGFIGKLWDGFKNLTGIGAGSQKAEKALDDYENGKIAKKEMEKAVNGYQEGQKQCVDMVADIVSGIASFGAFSFAAGLGLIATPFTGGASLGLVIAGFGVAGAAGAAVKVGVKGIDAVVGGRKYDSIGYDLATGGINGVFAPVTAGIGGVAGKAVASKIGVTALREGGEVVIKEGIKNTAKGAVTKTLLTTNVKYVGGTMGARALALGADMAVNGAVSGGVDSAARYVAGDSEDKSVEKFAFEVAAGTIGGFILSPVIGGGMRVVGNGLGKATGKLSNKVDINYTKAKSAMANMPVVDNPDMEVVRGFGGILKQAQSLADDVQVRGASILDGLDGSIGDISDNVNGIIRNTSALNQEMNAISKENRALMVEILEDLANGKDVTSKVFKLAQKGISLADLIDDRVGALSQDLDDKLTKILAANENLTQKATTGVQMASETLDAASNLVQETIEQAKKIPDTNAYKQLGDLPERAKKLYSALRTDASVLDDEANAARAKILNGNIEEGLSDLSRYYDELDAFSEKLEQQITDMHSSAARSGIIESADVLKTRLHKLMMSEEFKNMTREEQVQAIMENSNILLSKFAQTFSTDDSLPTEVSKIFKQFTSNCTVSRSMAQAQQFADELYGAGKYTILKSFGAGTIGETYLAKTADGTEVVIKMLKDGVTPERFAEDRAVFIKYISEFVSDPAEKEYKTNLINSMFDAWDKELNFGLEAQGAKDMAQGAQRFNVVQTLEIGSRNGQNVSLVMEKANGVRLDNLLEMIKLYRENPTEYFSKYADEIKTNPALKTPENWINDLGTAYQKAQNEQAMFIGKNGTRTLHADPHPGNVFIDFDSKTGKPIINYIDTGNTVQRTNSQTLQDIGLSINMMFGNSEGIARAMMDGARLPLGANKEVLVKQFAQMLDERLYKAGVNLKSTQYTQNTINGIMKELNIVPNAGNSNLMKATLQRIETSRAINRVCGTSSSKTVDIKDLAAGILKSFKVNPKDTWQTIAPIIKWAYKNNDQAMITFFQMIMKNASTQTATTV